MTTKNENMIVLAAYIAVYLEDGNGWESNAFELKATMHKGAPFKRYDSIWKFLVGRIGSVQLGLLCSLACIVFTVSKLVTASQTDEMVLPIICIVLSITLYILIRVLTKNVLNLREQKKSLYSKFTQCQEQQGDYCLLNTDKDDMLLCGLTFF